MVESVGVGLEMSSVAVALLEMKNFRPLFGLDGDPDGFMGDRRSR
jgi:hypothetical protein